MKAAETHYHLLKATHEGEERARDAFEPRERADGQALHSQPLSFSTEIPLRPQFGESCNGGNKTTSARCFHIGVFEFQLESAKFDILWSELTDELPQHELGRGKTSEKLAWVLEQDLLSPKMSLKKG